MALILIADDDAATRDLLRRALESDGHTVTIASDGSEALEKLARAGIDLLISDVDMPGLDGIALVGQALGKNPRLRVLFMSGYPDQLGRAAATTGGTARTIAKPFTLEKARSEVRAALA
jgi:CheY-like chemotaxis protein